MLLKILQCIAWMPPPTTKNYPSEISILLRLKNPDPYESITNLTLMCFQITLDDLHVPFLLETTIEQ